MRLSRIAHRDFADLGGSGGLYVSGRWHRSGRAVVYTASSPSLAAIEILGHTDSDILPPLVLLTIEAPDDITSEADLQADLPGRWRDVPPPATCQHIGDQWLAAARTCLLWVPSVHVPVERNALINPAHPQAARIRVITTEPFAFDPRVIKRP